MATWRPQGEGEEPDAETDGSVIPAEPNGYLLARRRPTDAARAETLRQVERLANQIYASLAEYARTLRWI